MSKSNLSPIERTVKEALKTSFEDTAPTFVIAVSGGMDSMGLMHAFWRCGLSGVVAHINYQKRGAASDKDARLVEKMSNQWGFQYEMKEADPEDAQNKNFQQWAREYRYRFFRDLVAKYEAHGIALAHHRDDQIETILQKLFRGAGLAGWSGMDVWDGELFRPLLTVSRNQIEDYIGQYEIPYRTDESNFKSDFARNFLRNEWTQQLSDFFPGWEDNVLRVRKEAENYEAALSWIADRIVNKKRIDKAKFDSLAPGLQRALILYLLKKLNPDIHISQQNLHRINEVDDLQTGKEIELTPEFSLVRDRQEYVLRNRNKSKYHPQTLSRSELESKTQNIQELTLSIEEVENPDYEQSLYLDVDKIAWPITIRTWQHGDRLQPLGMEGHQSVAEHLTNRKVSAAEKERALVIESFEETICAIIFPAIKNQSSAGTISEQVKLDPETKCCLTIK